MSPQLSQSLNATAFLREKQLVGNARKGILGMVPFSRATLWRKVKDGSFPRPTKLSERTTAWPTAEVLKWIADPMGYRSSSLNVGESQQ